MKTKQNKKENALLNHIDEYRKFPDEEYLENLSVCLPASLPLTEKGLCHTEPNQSSASIHPRPPSSTAILDRRRHLPCLLIFRL